jgi:hypothetical protein
MAIHEDQLIIFSQEEIEKMEQFTQEFPKAQLATYRLAAVVDEIKEDGNRGHLVAHVTTSNPIFLSYF